MYPWRDLPRERLAFLPTPLEPAPRLTERLGCNLFVKREDQSGLGMGVVGGIVHMAVHVYIAKRNTNFRDVLQFPAVHARLPDDALHPR